MFDYEIIVVVNVWIMALIGVFGLSFFFFLFLLDLYVLGNLYVIFILF